MDWKVYAPLLCITAKRRKDGATPYPPFAHPSLLLNITPGVDNDNEFPILLTNAIADPTARLHLRRNLLRGGCHRGGYPTKFGFEVV